jgi:hypothetical protein
MSSFESTLARMKDLYTYGKELNENSKAPVYTLEHSAKAADGKTYGIIRECNKYYIKSAPKGKERIAEAYDYLGGICNKKNYEYTSYNNALKNFELKMASINEACDANVNISTLDPFKKGDFIVEGTEKMKNEIARQRQIMYNASMIMNESTEIGADRKDDVVMHNNQNKLGGKTGKRGDECVTDKKANANPAYAGSKTNGVNKKVAPFNTAIQEGCECGDACSCEDDWASRGMCKGRDPKSMGWDIEVKADSQALTKLSTGSLAVWAAAWGSTVDPDMYQVYHMDSTATSTYAWGYREIKEKKDGALSYEYGLIQELSGIIDEARETNDQEERSELYKDAMTQILDLAIELPVYQRDVLYAYDATVIKSSSMPSEINPYTSPLDHIWEIEFAD